MWLVIRPTQHNYIFLRDILIYVLKIMILLLTYLKNMWYFCQGNHPSLTLVFPLTVKADITAIFPNIDDMSEEQKYQDMHLCLFENVKEEFCFLIGDILLWCKNKWNNVSFYYNNLCFMQWWNLLLMLLFHMWLTLELPPGWYHREDSRYAFWSSMWQQHKIHGRSKQWNLATSLFLNICSLFSFTCYPFESPNYVIETMTCNDC